MESSRSELLEQFYACFQHGHSIRWIVLASLLRGKDDGGREGKAEWLRKQTVSVSGCPLHIFYLPCFGSLCPLPHSPQLLLTPSAQCGVHRGGGSLVCMKKTRLANPLVPRCRWWGWREVGIADITPYWSGTRHRIFKQRISHNT